MRLSDLIKEMIDASNRLRDGDVAGISRAEKRYKAAKEAIDEYERQLLGNFSSPSAHEWIWTP